MLTVKVRRSLFGTEFGEVRRGDLVMVSDTTAREWIKRELADPVDELPDLPERQEKEAPKHKDKMAPRPKTKADEDLPGTSRDDPRPAKIPKRKSE